VGTGKQALSQTVGRITWLNFRRAFWPGMNILMYMDNDPAIPHLGMDPTSVSIQVPNNLLTVMHSL